MYVCTYRHIKQHLIGCPHYLANLCSCREVKLRHILTQTAFSEVYGGEIASGVCIQWRGKGKGCGWEGGERGVDGREGKGVAMGGRRKG